jgi:hypothetical protein
MARASIGTLPEFCKVHPECYNNSAQGVMDTDRLFERELR